MRELQRILEAYRNHLPMDAPLALATVVRVEGSAYRRPGARMLIYPDGRRIGSISGGCLEADVILQAREAARAGEPVYVHYDTRLPNGDLLFESGCRGAVGILIEPIVTPTLLCCLEFLAGRGRQREPGALATVFRAQGSRRIWIGARLMRRRSEAVQGNLDDPALATALLPDMEAVMRSGRALVKTFPLPEGEAELLIEPVRPPVALLICGAGPDAVPVAEMAGLLGWQVTVADHRDALLTPERFPGVEALLPERRKDQVLLDARTAAILMTHSYVQDRIWLEHLLPSSIPYIGLLGPRSRGEQLLQDLRHDGLPFDKVCLARLHSPTGLDLDAETPEEIALSILSEIQAVLSGRSGGALRDQPGSIHAPPLGVS